MTAGRGLLRVAMGGPARLYELGVRTRIAAYETNYLKARKLDTAVLSIGNITVGGTGKTPLVEYIGRYLLEEGYSVAILTRGYGRRSRGQRVLNYSGGTMPSASELTAPGMTGEAAGTGKSGDDEGGCLIPRGTGSYVEFGDEPVMLARSLPDVPVIINNKRVEGGAWAEQHLHSDVLILDDGYQHMALARDVNILLLDATDPFGGFEMVPFGRLREPLYGIKRADAVIVTRAHRAFDQDQIVRIVKYFRGDKVPIMYVYSSITRLRHLTSAVIYDASELKGWNASVMCGIGNPNSFSSDLLQIGINVASEHFFRDHHAFTQDDLDRVTAEAGRVGADMMVTTQKDAVRLEGLRCGPIPIYAAELEVQSEDEVRLKSLLLRSLLVRR
jgi:tetraacyldisaccharide 4'-kinase